MTNEIKALGRRGAPSAITAAEVAAHKLFVAAMQAVPANDAASARACLLAHATGDHKARLEKIFRELNLS